MRRHLFLVLALIIVLSAQTQPASAAPTGNFNVYLNDGRFVQAVSYSIEDDYVILRYPSGARSKFLKADIDLSSLPADREFDPQPSTPEGSKPHKQEQKEEEFESLREAASNIHLTTDHIEINQTYPPGGIPPKVASRDEPSNWEREREETLRGFEATVAPVAKVARRLDENARRYSNACSGATTTYHKGTTTGTGITTGKGWLHPNGGPYAGNYAGTYNHGPSDYSYEGVGVWQEEHESTSKTFNADTPYCKSLAADIEHDYALVGPVIESAVIYALLPGIVVQRDLDSILMKYGIPPVAVWTR